MPCEPVTVRCGCGATIQCQHDAESDAVTPVHGGPECRAACGQELVEQGLAMAKTLLDFGAHVDDGYLNVEIGETRCPSCRSIVRVDVPRVGWPRLVSRDGHLHYCAGLGIGRATFDAEAAQFPRAPQRTRPRTADTVSDAAPPTPTVEVPRLG